jgi:hypothetical protein
MGWVLLPQSNLPRHKLYCWMSYQSFIYRGGGGFPEGVHYYVGPGAFSPRKYLKCEAWKCHFLHSEHNVYLLNLSSQTQYLYFGQKWRKVLRYMVTDGDPPYRLSLLLPSPKTISLEARPKFDFQSLIKTIQSCLRRRLVSPIGARIFSRIPVFENRNCVNESE